MISEGQWGQLPSATIVSDLAGLAGKRDSSFWAVSAVLMAMSTIAFRCRGLCGVWGHEAWWWGKVGGGGFVGELVVFHGNRSAVRPKPEKKCRPCPPHSSASTTFPGVISLLAQAAHSHLGLSGASVDPTPPHLPPLAPSSSVGVHGVC